MTVSGLLLVDKTGAWTSHDVVAKTRRLANTRAVGHAGTLDPMATGLLILGINNATKLLTFLVGESKTYLATIRLGASTNTDDAEGEITATANASDITTAQIEKALENFRGEIMQVPSSVSAIKVDGKRAYAQVRSGVEVKLQARPVTITKFEILGEPRRDGEFLDIDVEVDCSSGTYIRALARDLGAALAVGGHLTALRRTRIGKYSVEQAKTLEQLEASEQLPIVGSAEAAKQQFEVQQLSSQDEIDLRHGKRIKPLAKYSSSPIAGINQAGHLVAMLELSGNQLKSLVVFQPEA
ncbi:MAG: tRNA pseudouridine(55) synthase TruB [Micrococcales bacterium]